MRFSQRILMFSLILTSVACTVAPNSTEIDNHRLLQRLTSELNEIRATMAQQKEQSHSNELIDLTQVEDFNIPLKQGFTLSAAGSQNSLQLSPTPILEANPASTEKSGPEFHTVKASLISLNMGMWIDKPEKLTDKPSSDSYHGYIKIQKQVDSFTSELTTQMFKADAFPTLILTIERKLNPEGPNFKFRLFAQGHIISVDHKGNRESGIIEEVLIDPLQYACNYQQLDASGNVINDAQKWGWSFFNSQPVTKDFPKIFFEDEQQ